MSRKKQAMSEGKNSRAGSCHVFVESLVDLGHFFFLASTYLPSLLSKQARQGLRVLGWGLINRA
jgi:hypothetical protein